MTHRTALVATAIVIVLLVVAAAARRAGPGSSAGAVGRLPRRRGSEAAGAEGEETSFTSRPVPRSVAALTTPEQADSPMVHGG